MKDPLELFNKIKVVAPKAEIRKAVLKKIDALEKDSITSFRFFAIAAGVCALIGSSLYTSLENDKLQNQQENTGFFDQSDIYE